MDTRSDSAVETQVETVLWNREAVVADELGIGEFETRRVVSDSRSVEQDRPLTAELQSVARDKASIGREVTLFLLLDNSPGSSQTTTSSSY